MRFFILVLFKSSSKVMVGGHRSGSYAEKSHGRKKVFGTTTANVGRGCATNSFILNTNLNMNVADVEFFGLKYSVQRRVEAFLVHIVYSTWPL